MLLNLDFYNFRSFKEHGSFTTEPTSSEAKIDNLLEERTGDGMQKSLKVSLLFGANASGKTNIVKLMYRIRRWVLNLDNREGDSIPLYDPFKFDNQSATAPSGFAIEFTAPIEDRKAIVRYRYEVKFEEYEILEERLLFYPQGRQTLIFERIKSEDERLDTIKSGPTIKKVTKLSVFKNQLLLSKFLIDTPHQDITPAARFFSNMVVSNGYHEDCLLGIDKELKQWLTKNSEYKDKLAEFLSACDTGVNNFEVIKQNNDYQVESYHTKYKDGEDDGSERLPFENESFGTRALFIIGCHILKALSTGSPLWVDEMDSGLHSYVSKLIMGLFRNVNINKNHAQLIFTTHDVNLLDQDVIRKDQVWFTEKNEKGESELYSLSDFAEVRETTPFAKWYMNNKFGGVPSLASIENIFKKNGKEE